MTQLNKTLMAWGSPDFEATLKQEIEQLKVDQLPLQEGLSVSSHALDDNLKVIIMKASRDDECIRVNAGIFYSGVISGCNCADDPTPVDKQVEYCEVRLEINTSTAETIITLIGEQN